VDAAHPKSYAYTNAHDVHQRRGIDVLLFQATAQKQMPKMKRMQYTPKAMCKHTKHDVHQHRGIDVLLFQATAQKQRPKMKRMRHTPKAMCIHTKHDVHQHRAILVLLLQDPAREQRPKMLQQEQEKRTMQQPGVLEQWALLLLHVSLQQRSLAWGGGGSRVEGRR